MIGSKILVDIVCHRAIQPLGFGFYQCRHIKGHPAYVHPNPLVQPEKTRYKFKSKHANPKFRRERAMKVMKIDLPDYEKERREEEKQFSPEEMNKKMREMGIQPFRPWNEKPLYISSTSGAIDPYVPPEGDGKANFLSKEGAKQKFEFAGKKGKSLLSIKKIRQYEEDFDSKVFAEESLNIYIKLHEALANFNEKEMHKLATEKAYPLLINDTKNKTIKWGFHGSLERPRVVHARDTKIVTDDNIFAQLTVRFHTQQTLAVYDRFGRLMHGSEIVLRDVLEYVIFEKNISNTYGLWRVHEKIIPEWMHLKPTSVLTFALKN